MSAPKFIDVPIPETGWERDTVTPDTDARAWAIDSLIGAIAPAPRWVYEANTLARYHCSPMRLHPAEYYRLLRASWLVAGMPVMQPPWAVVLGTEIIVDQDTPEGVIRLTERPPAPDWTRGW